MSEPPVTLSALAEYHHEVLAPDFQRVYERLDRMVGRIEAHFDEVCRRFDHLETEYSAVQAVLARIDRFDELALRFERTENLLDQLADQILELRTVGALIAPPSSH